MILGISLTFFLPKILIKEILFFRKDPSREIRKILLRKILLERFLGKPVLFMILGISLTFFLPKILIKEILFFRKDPSRKILFKTFLNENLFFL